MAHFAATRFLGVVTFYRGGFQNVKLGGWNAKFRVKKVILGRFGVIGVHFRVKNDNFRHFQVIKGSKTAIFGHFGRNFPRHF